MNSLQLLPAFLLFAAPAFAQGPLTPPSGTPAPAMKSLDQVEARTPVPAGGAYTISQSGSYYLTGNITVTGGNGITINAANVTLDLNGFTIRSTAASPSGTGIQLSATSHQTTVLNGSILGPGFVNGVYGTPNNPTHVVVRGVTVKSCQVRGIALSGVPTLVESCTVSGISSTDIQNSIGITADVVKSCIAADCASRAIEAEIVDSSRGHCTSGSSSPAIYGGSVTGCSAKNDGVGGGIIAKTAAHSTGESAGGFGIQTEIADHCRGLSTSSGGLYATASATGCVGSTATGGFGLSTGTANSCRGIRTGDAGVAIQATIAIGCTISGTGAIVSSPNKHLGTP